MRQDSRHIRCGLWYDCRNRPNGASLLTSAMEQCLISKGHGCKEYDCEQSLVHHRGWQRHWCRHR